MAQVPRLRWPRPADAVAEARRGTTAYWPTVGLVAVAVVAVRAGPAVRVVVAQVGPRLAC